MKKNTSNLINVDDKTFQGEKTITVSSPQKLFPSSRILKFSLFTATVLSLFLLTSVTTVAQDVNDVLRTVAANPQGEEVTISLNQYRMGRKLFNVSCGECHAGGITKTSETVSLSAEDLAKAVPKRNNIEGLVNYMKNPTTTDGKIDISILHPSKMSQDMFTYMRRLSEEDLLAIAGYILVEIKRVGKQWGPTKK